MHDIIAKVAHDAAKKLQGIRAKYIIVLPDGEILSHGGLELKKDEECTTRLSRRRDGSSPYTVLRKLALPKFEQMEVSDVVEIDVPDGIGLPEAQSACASIANSTWGSGNYQTMRNPKTHKIEVLRLG